MSTGRRYRGVHAVGSTDRGPKDLMHLVPIPNKAGLAAADVTPAEAPESAGDAAAVFGKWHPEGETEAKERTRTSEEPGVANSMLHDQAGPAARIPRRDPTERLPG